MKNLKNIEELNQALAKLGENQRELSIAKAELDEQIADLQGSYAPLINSLTKEVEKLEKVILAFCDTNYSLVFKNGLKTAKLITGEISRKMARASISVIDEQTAIKQIKEQGLTRFLKIKESLNKNALLNELDFLEKIEGIELNQGIENIIIKPYQTLK